jgi:membrane associated rhomboid family serine protease
MSRLLDAVKSIPLCTLAIISVCAALQLYVFLFDADVVNFALSGRAVLYLGEYYRLLTSAFFHGGLQHIFFNMMSVVTIGSGVERSLGTIAMAHVALWSVLLGSLLFVAIQWTMTFLITGDGKYIAQPAVGFSGAIFALAVLESYRSLQPTRSVFGFFSVPTRVYPWVLMALIQYLVPNVSLVGHLAGILVGLLHVYGSTSFLIPSPAQCRSMEDWACAAPLSRLSSFVPCPQPLPNSSAGTVPDGGILVGVRDGVLGLLRVFWWIFATALHVLGLHSPSGSGSGSVSST